MAKIDIESKNSGLTKKLNPRVKHNLKTRVGRVLTASYNIVSRN